MKQRTQLRSSRRNRVSTAKREQYVPESVETYVLWLFVAGDRPQSLEARKNIEQIRKMHLRSRCELTVFDVCEDSAIALDHGIVVTPTLLLLSPAPRVTIIGNLRDTHKVLAALRVATHA
jgi:circadian clock protein KaiB